MIKIWQQKDCKKSRYLKWKKLKGIKALFNKWKWKKKSKKFIKIKLKIIENVIWKKDIYNLTNILMTNIKTLIQN